MDVHPYAAAFPMMSDDELDALADDIRANGQRHPIVVDAAGMLIDGRNRLAACERAEVEPMIMTLAESIDSVGYITSANVRRRNMTKGQTAVVAVRAFIGSINLDEIAHRVGVTTAAAGHAAVIVEYAPDLADRVLGGNPPLPFDAAYREAKDRRNQRRTAAQHDAELRREAPDLAEMVAEEALTFEEAWAAYEKRTEDARRAADEREAGRQRRNIGAAEALHKLAWTPGEVDGFVTEVWPHHERHVVNGMRITPQRLDAAIVTLIELRKRIAT
ncbi:MAG TPA: ParB N-terminal domain-containing protein [Mycobacterium sp.]|jgi:hypothetical protein